MCLWRSTLATSLFNSLDQPLYHTQWWPQQCLLFHYTNTAVMHIAHFATSSSLTYYKWSKLEVGKVWEQTTLFFTFGISSLGTSRCVRWTATCISGSFRRINWKSWKLTTTPMHDIWDYIVVGDQRSRISEISHSCMWLYFPAIVPWSVNDEICRLTAWSTTKWSP